MFGTKYDPILPKGRSVICGKAAGGSHLNSLPENQGMRCRYLARMAKSGRTISHVLFSLRILETSASLGCEAARTFPRGTFRICT